MTVQVDYLPLRRAADCSVHRGVCASGASLRITAMFQTEGDLQNVRVPDRVDKRTTATAEGYLETNGMCRSHKAAMTRSREEKTTQKIEIETR
jgi:hypothetical protein